MERGASASRKQKGGTNPRLGMQTWAGNRPLTGRRGDKSGEHSEGGSRDGTLTDKNNKQSEWVINQGAFWK